MLRFVSCFALFALLSSCALGGKQPQSAGAAGAALLPPYPPSPTQDVADTIHGELVRDPFRWLEQVDSPQTQTWLKAQDAYGRRALAQLPMRPAFRERLEQLSYVDGMSPISRAGSRYFFTRRHRDKEKAVHYFKEGESGPERVLIDPNTFSDDGSVSLRGTAVSWDGTKLAYKLSKNAADAATLYVRDVASGKDSSIDVIEGAKYASPQWTPNAQGFYYTRLPTDASIPVADLPGHAAVYYHRLGDDPKNDVLVFEKTGDPTKFVYPQISRDGSLLFVFVYHGWTKTDVYFKDLKRGDKSFRPLAVGTDANYQVATYRRNIFVMTNDGAPRYRVFSVSPKSVARSAWREVVPEDQAAVLKDVSVRGKKLALSYLVRATSEIRLAELDGSNVRKLNLPGIGSASGLFGHPEDDSATFSFANYITPKSVYRASIVSGAVEAVFTPDLPIDSSRFVVEQVFYPSKDGTRVSMFVARLRPNRGAANEPTPLLLYGYGGFNISLTPYFSTGFYVWLEQGGTVAIPNLRGGGEYGEAWHKAGMLLNKQNVFDDFISAAAFLIEGGYTTAEQLAIQGGSNGGLLVGAAMTQRPDLFRAVACHVPLLDMVRYHLFGSGKTWIEEYGSADDPAQFDVLFNYSPYHAVKPAVDYPALLMLTADSDDRVDPMHARKFVAAVQSATSGRAPVVLRLEAKAGHGGGDMIKKKVARTADVLAFLWDQVGPRAQLSR